MTRDEIMNAKRLYEIREVIGTVSHGYHVTKDEKMWGVYLMPFDINVYLCKSKEEAESYIERKERK